MNWTRNYDVTTQRQWYAPGPQRPGVERARREAVDIESLEHAIRPLFETICGSLSCLVEEMDKVPAWMAELRRPPLSSEARAILEGRLLYDSAVTLLADADRVRALKGWAFVKEVDPFRSVFQDRRRASPSDEAELVAEWRSMRDARPPTQRPRLFQRSPFVIAARVANGAPAPSRPGARGDRDRLRL